MSSAAGTKLNPRNFPRPPACEKTPRHLEVKWGGQTIADTKEGYWALETYHPPTYYLPPSSMTIPLSKNSNTSFCEWKGRATYFDATNPSNPGEVVKSRIWTYENPTPGFKDIKGYLSLYAGPWDCYVDGEKVEPQPGDFYGGWMTSDIEREHVKGAPGTRHWLIAGAIPPTNPPKSKQVGFDANISNTKATCFGRGCTLTAVLQFLKWRKVEREWFRYEHMALRSAEGIRDLMSREEGVGG